MAAAGLGGGGTWKEIARRTRLGYVTEGLCSLGSSIRFDLWSFVRSRASGGGYRSRASWRPNSRSRGRYWHLASRLLLSQSHSRDRSIRGDAPQSAAAGGKSVPDQCRDS